VEVTRANLGGYPSIYRIKNGGGVAFRFDTKYVDIEDVTREFEWEQCEWGLKSEPGLAPFERADFGSRDRLAWPGHACSIPRDASLVVVDRRMACWVEDETLAAVHVDHDAVIRIPMPDMFNRWHPIAAHDQRLWIETSKSLLWFAVAAVEPLFTRAPGPLAIRVREIYPARKSHAVAAHVTGRSRTETRAHTADKRREFNLPLMPELTVDTDIELHDEVMEGYFLAMTIAGKRYELNPEPPAESTIETTLQIDAAIDPAGELVKPSDSARQVELDRLFAARAEDPDDPATPMVIVDLLEEAGEPYATNLAQLVAGETRVDARRAALGTLMNYISTTDYRGGLPFRGVLSPSAPLDDEIGDLVASDQRLGFYHTLLIGEGDYRVYIKLVASPRAAGLRTIEAPRAQILNALIANKRTSLKRIMGIKFANREVIEALADATFDGLREIETETAVATAPRLLEFITRDELGFFKRAPRHVTLREKTGSPQLIQPVLAAWKELPVDAMTISNVTLHRDGTASPGPAPNNHVLEAIRGMFKIL
jgi:hypothetical protein